MKFVEVIWTKQILHSLGVAQDKPIPMFCDNQVTVHIANNPVFHKRTKHIEVDCHFVRKKRSSRRHYHLLCEDN